jgi:uncharacterized protein (TIGR03435 family)
MTRLLLEFAIRTTLVAAGTALVLALLRIRTASVRHAAWSAVLMTMLVLPLLMAGRVRLTLPVLTPAATGTSMAPAATTGVAVPVGAQAAESRRVTSPAPAPASPGPLSPLAWTSWLLALYVTGAAILLLRLVLGTVQANRLRREALVHDGRLTSDRCVTPITVGWFAPVLILPRDWSRWPAEQLAVVLTHEQEHARRHDPLVQWLALFSRAMFWFHPLAWWLERRLAALAEEACDTAVIAAGHSPQTYSQYLLDMARTVAVGGGRVRLGMAMPGTGLAHRLRAIGAGLRPGPISRVRLAGMMAICLASSTLFAAGRLAERTSDLRNTGGPRVQGDTQTPSAPDMTIKYEAVSIRPCDTSASGTGRGGGGNSPRFAITPGYVSWGCVSLVQLIDNAWGGAPPNNALLNTLPGRPGDDGPKRVRGGPSWVEDEKFAIEIRISGDTTDLTGSARHTLVNNAMGPALRAMLADRFQLKVRKMTEERPMYALTVAAGGHKLKPAEPGDCAVLKEGMPPPSRTGLLDGKWLCGVINETLTLDMQERRKAGESPATLMAGKDRRQAGETAATGIVPVGPDRRMEAYRVSLQALARRLAGMMDQFVVDRSGVTGEFTFALEYTTDDHTPRTGWGMVAGQPDWPPGNIVPAAIGRNQTIFKSLEALGLKLQPTKGPAEYLLIESAQRPAPGAPGQLRADAAR